MIKQQQKWFAFLSQLLTQHTYTQIHVGAIWKIFHTFWPNLTLASVTNCHTWLTPCKNISQATIHTPTACILQTFALKLSRSPKTVCWVAMVKVNKQQLTDTWTSMIGLQLYSTQFISCCLNSVHPVLQVMKCIASYEKTCFINFTLQHSSSLPPVTPIWLDAPFRRNIFLNGPMHVLTTNTHNHFYGPLGFCPGLPGWAGTRNVKPIWIYWSKR